MPILSGDVKLLKSVVMADVPEGGGAPTGNVIADGVSNAIFPDISELDRAGGRVNLRKTFVNIQTDDTDTYFGANVIVAEPPQDPRVSVTLFSTGSTFDTRTSASSRVESYLNKGSEWPGFLYENHIAGQRAIQIFQRPEAELPTVGKTLVLVANEGTVSEVTQYVRATEVSAVTRLFYDATAGRDYSATVVTMKLSDALRTDFTGTSANRSYTRASNAAKIRDTIVADAGTYVGVVPLTTEADLGDFTIEASSIYTQLVPSAQTETPISDVKTNGLSTALAATGGPVTQSLTLAFTTTQAMYVGGPIYPGSLSIVRSGITLNDSAGLLMNAGVEVGSVDYDNGIVTLSSNVFGTSGGTHTVTFTPAEVPDLISEQSELPITPESRSLSYAFTLGSVPLPGTLTISYMAQGRWYVLRDNKAGVLKGSDAAFGVGTLNYTTGSVVVTLGALPDVGSSLIIGAYSDATTATPSNTDLLNGGKFYVALNTSGQNSEETGSKPIAPNTLIVSWNNGGTKTAIDNGNGVLTGDATGTVDYSNGVIRISPTTMPAPGTTFVFDITSNTKQSVTASFASGTLNIGATNITPGSIAMTANVLIQYTWERNTEYSIEGGQDSRTTEFPIYDRGGILYARDRFDENIEYQVGTIDYATGVINIVPAVSGSGSGTRVYDSGGPSLVGQQLVGVGFSAGWRTAVFRWNEMKATNQVRSLTYANQTITVSFAQSSPNADSLSATVNTLRARTSSFPNYTLRGVNFNLGTDRYMQLTDGTLVRNPSATTGVGTPVGTVSGATGTIFLTSWSAGTPTAITNWRGLMAPATVGTVAPFTSFETVFRTASAPLRPGSFSVLGTMQDGTTFNVSADTSGKINGSRVKGTVDYEYGLVRLHFTNPLSTGYTKDLSYLNIAGVSTVNSDLVQLNSLRYNAVAYSYLPLDANILGIDPVRLPSDGRVPIFRAGGFAVVGHTGEITATVSNGQTINCGRVRLSRVRVIGNNGAVINTGYTADLEAGTVTFTNVSGYSQPVTVEHRIEDMGVVREAQINGEITFTRALTHDYPIGSYVSSALVAGDLFARVSLLFDQASWNGTWTDAVVGGSATATFNSAQYPITVTNRGALTERWIIQFTNSTSYNVIGENVGVIASGTTSATCAPLNPATGVPYFSINPLGFGSGWATGNVIRFNTIGAQYPVWVVRTVQQGPETVVDDSFTLLIRGDVDTP